MADAIEWEQADCLLCGAADRAPSDSVVWRDATFQFVLCRGCGLKYMYPRPTQRWYQALYRNEFWQEKVEYRGFRGKGPLPPLPAGDGLRKRISRQLLRAERIVSMLERTVQLTADALVVDVGAAFGITLHVMRHRYRCRVLAVEPSDEARAYGERELHIAYAARYMEELFEPGPLDGTVTLLIMSQALENMLDPRAALAAARRLLAPGGRIYVDTSNFFYYNAINPYHPYIFSPDTLEALMAQVGLRVIDRQHEPSPDDALVPSDPYLTFVAEVGDAAYRYPSVDVEALTKAQAVGLRKFADARKARKLTARAIAAAAETVFPETPRPARGCVVFLTGLSASGKSTLARLLEEALREQGRTVTLLDGDVVRARLSPELGFSKDGRALNMARVGFMAAEIARHGGIAVCACIAPYADARHHVRALVEQAGTFVLVHVATPLAVCEARDTKGLYARARAGQLPMFTGISDPYETPQDASLVLDMTAMSAETACKAVLRHLADIGVLADATRQADLAIALSGPLR